MPGDTKHEDHDINSFYSVLRLTASALSKAVAAHTTTAPPTVFVTETPVQTPAKHTAHV